MDDGALRDRVVVVTGASAGVGLAAARAFAARGARLGLLARDPERLEHVRRDLSRDGAQVCVVPGDVARQSDVARAARRFEQELGDIDVWVNNAMTTVLAPFLEITPKEFERVTKVTYLGYVNGTRVALERMVERDQGVIVQVGSALAYRAIPMQSAYCGAKHAIEGFTESVRCELLHQRSAVEITMVQLPAVNTPQFEWMLSKLPNRPRPVKPVYQPEVAAEAIVGAALRPRKEMWAGWGAARAIMANRFVPGLLDRYLARVGVKGQQTDEPIAPDAPNNLFEPVPGDYGAHGPFDESSHAHSPVVWMAAHRRVLGAVAGTLGGAVGVLRAVRKHARNGDGSRS